MMARLSAFVIWAVVAAAMVFWGMRLVVRADPVPLNAVVVSEGGNVRGDLTRLLGAEPVAQVAVAPQASSRFRLLGVMAGKPDPQGGKAAGVALISVDGKPARAFSAGARIEDKLVLQNVSLRTASVGVDKGPTSFVLELPALPPPSTGTLPKPTFDQTGPTPAPAPALSGQVPPATPRVQSPGAPPAQPGTRSTRPGMGNPNASR